MPRALRILHLADSHIGAALPARPRTKRRTRGDDLVDSYRRVLARAREHEVDLVLHGGDVFDAPDPDNAALSAAAAPLLALAADGIPVVVVPGNHERSALPASLLLSHGNVHLIDRPRTVSLTLGGWRVAIAGVPCLRRQVARDFEPALAATGWSAARADLNILLLHQTIESAVCGPVGFRFRAGEDVLGRDQVPAGFDYVALGHIHRQQALPSLLPGGPPFVYPGSPDRVSFAERDEPKGCVLIHWDGGRVRHEFLEHAVRPMEVLPLDVTGLGRAQLEDAIGDALRRAAPQALLNLRLSGHAVGRTLRGLRLQRRAAAERPDVLLSASLQQVELIPERSARTGGTASRSAFAALPGGRPLNGGGPGGLSVAGGTSADAPGGGVARGAIDRLGELENTCGTYALRDQAGRLLYVGKAQQLRTRLRTHLAGRGAAEFFSGWTRQIAGFEARGAWSELEALLAEAELIRTLRPPFNRALKAWARFCYLTSGRRAHGQFEVTAEPDPEGWSVGPFRSRMAAELAIETAAAVFGTAACPPGHAATLPLLGRGERAAGAAEVCARFYAGVCSGPCGQRIEAAEYEGRLAARDALLGGVDPAQAEAWEAEHERRAAAGADHEALRPWRQTSAALRGMFDTGALLRACEALIGGVVVLPGGPAARLALVFEEERTAWFRLATKADAERVLRAAREAGAGRPDEPRPCVPRALTDVLATVVRYALRHPQEVTLAPRALLRRPEARAMLTRSGPQKRRVSAALAPSA